MVHNSFKFDLLEKHYKNILIHFNNSQFIIFWTCSWVNWKALTKSGIWSYYREVLSSNCQDSSIMKIDMELSFLSTLTQQEILKYLQK